MKTEKRIIAFALSIIMLLGIMILSAGAAAPDVPSADITYDSDNEWENTLVINENITVKIYGVTHENSGTAASAIK
ncbi:MAG: hypothetical protein IK063_01850, partial [Clostridia bacterium]|nr:hypothetical protein [Clostridia bacterium]